MNKGCQQGVGLRLQIVIVLNVGETFSVCGSLLPLQCKWQSILNTDYVCVLILTLYT